MTRSLMVVLSVLAPLTASAEPPGANQKVAVLPLTANRIAEDAKKILDEVLVSEVSRVTAYQVIGSSDINAMLGLEKMKQAVGCDDVSCAAEIGGALGVDHLLSGSVSRLGSQLIVQLNLIDIRQRLVVKRGRGAVQNDEDAYTQGVAMAVGDLFGLGTAAHGAAAASTTTAAGPGAPFSLRVETEDRGDYNVAVEAMATGSVVRCPAPVTPDKPCMLRELGTGRGKLRLTGDIESTMEVDLPKPGAQAVVTLDKVPAGLPAACVASGVALPLGVVLLVTNIKKDDPATSQVEPGGLEPLGIVGAVIAGLGYIGALSTCLVWGVWQDVNYREVSGGAPGGVGLRNAPLATGGGANMFEASFALP